MLKQDPRIDAYIRNSAAFARPILTHLRKLVHTGCPDVEETLKWSMPFFMHKGMLCHMASFKNHCAFGFWKGRLMFGKQAKSDGMGHFGRITKLADLPPDKEIIDHIKKAVELNEAGIKAPRRVKDELVVPNYLRAALKKSKKALTTFESFSYSHKKEYVKWITEAKREETRQRRMETAIELMAKGKARR